MAEGTKNTDQYKQIILYFYQLNRISTVHTRCSRTKCCCVATYSRKCVKKLLLYSRERACRPPGRGGVPVGSPVSGLGCVILSQNTAHFAVTCLSSTQTIFLPSRYYRGTAKYRMNQEWNALLISVCESGVR